jgi:hypothetical protein
MEHGTMDENGIMNASYTCLLDDVKIISECRIRKYWGFRSRIRPLNKPIWYFPYCAVRNMHEDGCKRR